MKTLPIFICNFNRLGPTRALVESLLKRNYNNITIIDNASKFQPLLEWYANCPATVVRLDQNVHQGIFNLLPQFDHIRNNELYVWTDSDVVPVDETPEDFLDHMVEIIREHKMPKLVLSLKIDDLPEHYAYRDDVIKHESVFETYGHFDHERYGRVFKAPIDTTFAICGTPDCGLEQGAYRMAFPYAARHVPWYYDSNNLPDDEIFMRANINPRVGTQWSAKSG